MISEEDYWQKASFITSAIPFGVFFVSLYAIYTHDAS